MKTLEEIKKMLKEHEKILKMKYKTKKIGIFGSYVRDEEKERKSDLDILVEFDDGITLLKFIEMENYLSDLLGIKVDLVMKKALKPRIGENILKEVLYI
ncbi:MAG: nucleotidyltransferase family protein [Thermoplasmata archaeon]|nr:MAG: nucleotidyltransferase family protein [Thermoplasmata archaeon]